MVGTTAIPSSSAKSTCRFTSPLTPREGVELSSRTGARQCGAPWATPPSSARSRSEALRRFVSVAPGIGDGAPAFPPKGSWNELAVSTCVRHRKLPEWGMGIVLGVPAGNKVDLFFENHPSNKVVRLMADPAMLEIASEAPTDRLKAYLEAPPKAAKRSAKARTQGARAPGRHRSRRRSTASWRSSRAGSTTRPTWPRSGTTRSRRPSCSRGCSPGTSGWSAFASSGWTPWWKRPFRSMPRRTSSPLREGRIPRRAEGPAGGAHLLRRALGAHRLARSVRWPLRDVREGRRGSPCLEGQGLHLAHRDDVPVPRLPRAVPVPEAGIHPQRGRPPQARPRVRPGAELGHVRIGPVDGREAQGGAFGDSDAGT